MLSLRNCFPNIYNSEFLRWATPNIRHLRGWTRRIENTPEGIDLGKNWLTYQLMKLGKYTAITVIVSRTRLTHNFPTISWLYQHSSTYPSTRLTRSTMVYALIHKIHHVPEYKVPMRPSRAVSLCQVYPFIASSMVFHALHLLQMLKANRCVCHYPYSIYYVIYAEQGFGKCLPIPIFAIIVGVTCLSIKNLDRGDQGTDY